MKPEDMLLELRKVVKTPHPEVMILPYGNANPTEVIEWIARLSDKEFDLLMKTPIIVQAKIFYSNLRKTIKERK